MPTFIKPGFWEKTRKGYDHWLNLDLFVAQATVTPTLQQVLDNNHDLVDGNFFAGTDAGLNNIGTYTIAIGESAGVNNTGSNVVALGDAAGSNNSGSNIVVSGVQAGRDNTGNEVIALGSYAGNNNTGEQLIALGFNAGLNNTASKVIAFGLDAGRNNALPGMTIIANNSLPSFVDRAAAVAAITVMLGASVDCTYLYYNETTFAIEGVRL